ncbi:hypothetical protein HPB48_021545 [Haemaphysalis longicornis]|uniref:Uncharacterized protein n=1 Tax=Haemaphysalis longicornis TaxID=44386 RepID=A0A9J6GN01_HAELO|nr:hypothetical protein HPB48_021545 [Haemaphysalis longicornis]
MQICIVLKKTVFPVSVFPPQDGKSRCRRQRCAKLSCPIKFQKEDECCPRCADNGIRPLPASFCTILKINSETTQVMS